MTEEGRALLTETEREILSGEREVSDNYRYKVQSLVRNRVRKKLADDVHVLRRDFPEVFATIHTEVCDDEPDEDLAELRAERDQLRNRVGELEQRGDPVTPREIDPDDAKDWLVYANRALSELPEDVPGRSSVEDLRAELERAIRGAESDG